MNKAIHHISVGYLSFIILLRMMAMPISLVDFSLNRHYITEKFCENRFRTGVTCAGTCYLQKQMAKTSENHPGSDQKGSVKILLIDFFESFDKQDFSMVKILKSRILPHIARPLITRSPERVFHPPIA
jgi:hypothetical protein